jgi:small subunit ribosomal protein S20
MAHHLSAKKRIRQNQKLSEHNHYYAKSVRTAMKKLRTTTEKESANQQAPVLFSMLDKLAKDKVIHKNKAANLKSELSKHINSL